MHNITEPLNYVIQAEAFDLNDLWEAVWWRKEEVSSVSAPKNDGGNATAEAEVIVNLVASTVHPGASATIVSNAM